jgi:DNA-binding transcriptional regulator YiaG
MAFVLRNPPLKPLDTVDRKPVTKVSDAEIAAQIVQVADAASAFTAPEPAEAQRLRPGNMAREVRGVRERHGLSQVEFARRFGFTVDTIRKYEQGHRHPTGPARALLRVIAAEPEAVTRALRQDKSRR